MRVPKVMKSSRVVVSLFGLNHATTRLRDYTTMDDLLIRLGETTSFAGVEVIFGPFPRAERCDRIAIATQPCQ